MLPVNVPTFPLRNPSPEAHTIPGSAACWLTTRRKGEPWIDLYNEFGPKLQSALFESFIGTECTWTKCGPPSRGTKRITNWSGSIGWTIASSWVPEGVDTFAFKIYPGVSTWCTVKAIGRPI